MRAWRHTSGSCSRTHIILVRVKLVMARLQVSSTSRCSPTLAVIASTCAWVRLSHQMMEGRSTRPRSSSSTRPCICPERPTPAISPGGTLLSATTWVTAEMVACHQSSGCCSAQSG